MKDDIFVYMNNSVFNLLHYYKKKKGFFLFLAYNLNLKKFTCTKLRRAYQSSCFFVSIYNRPCNTRVKKGKYHTQDARNKFVSILGPSVLVHVFTYAV